MNLGVKLVERLENEVNERPGDVSLRGPSELPGVLVEVDVSPKARSELVDVDGTYQEPGKRERKSQR